jgi:hypothetical protein
MHSFTDTAGRTWSLRLTIAAVRGVRERAALDLCDLEGGELPLALRLERDPGLLLSALAALLEGQLQERGVSQADLEGSLDGSAYAAAAQAFWGELSDFFRPWRPETAAMIESLQPEKRPASPENSGDGSGNSPASSASTPAG